MPLSRRLAVVVLIAAAAAIAARIAAPSASRHAHYSGAVACGVERWNVKTLRDRPALLRARRTTVSHLVGLSRPAHVPSATRLPFERHIYSVVARVTLDRGETDGDLHF